MSDNYIPLDIKTDIMKKLLVKSLIQFPCVSKEWKSLIDSSEFIKSYQAMNHHLLVRKSVGILTPSKPRLYIVEYLSELRMSCIGFGVCPETNDPKIVKINTVDGSPYGYWEVQVYTLSSKVWKRIVYYARHV
ncbi:putative F-box domain-containing protein [Tanacetum coccineum]